MPRDEPKRVKKGTEKRNTTTRNFRRSLSTNKQVLNTVSSSSTCRAAKGEYVPGAVEAILVLEPSRRRNMTRAPSAASSWWPGQHGPDRNRTSRTCAKIDSSPSTRQAFRQSDAQRAWFWPLPTGASRPQLPRTRASSTSTEYPKGERAVVGTLDLL